MKETYKWIYDVNNESRNQNERKIKISGTEGGEKGTRNEAESFSRREVGEREKKRSKRNGMKQEETDEKTMDGERMNKNPGVARVKTIPSSVSLFSLLHRFSHSSFCVMMTLEGDTFFLSFSFFDSRGNFSPNTPVMEKEESGHEKWSVNTGELEESNGKNQSKSIHFFCFSLSLSLSLWLQKCSDHTLNKPSLVRNDYIPIWKCLGIELSFSIQFSFFLRKRYLMMTSNETQISLLFLLVHRTKGEVSCHGYHYRRIIHVGKFWIRLWWNNPCLCGSRNHCYF